MIRIKKHIWVIATILLVSFIVPNEMHFSKNELMGKVNPANDTNFIVIGKQYTSKSNIYLRKEAYEAFIKMYRTALEDNVELRIVSAFRSFNYQKYIWESKWNGKRKVDGENLGNTTKGDLYKANKILLYSSMPGSSRHHWGTDIDLNNLENKYFESGEGERIYFWLIDHANKFGYYQVYTAGRTNGYQEEKWHWSYLPLAKPMLDEYKKLIKTTDFKGFAGCKQANEVKIIQNYVLGINQACK
jgi:LAS superfamily LD-carboxypeptidase LdcB